MEVFKGQNKLHLRLQKSWNQIDFYTKRCDWKRKEGGAHIGRWYGYMLPLRPPFQAILLLQRPIISRPSSAQETPLILFFNVFSSSIFSDFGSISAPKTQFFCENLFPKPLFQAKKKKNLFPRPFFWKPAQHKITENDLNYLL